MDSNEYIAQLERYESLMSDSRYARLYQWIVTAGVVGSTVAINFSAELERNQHAAYTASGVAIAGLCAGMLEMTKRGYRKQANDALERCRIE